MNYVTQVGLFVLTLVALVGIVIMALASIAVPSEFWTITTVLVGATAGATIPNRSTVVRKEV